MRGVESFADVVHEIGNWRVCNFLEWIGRKYCLNREAFMNTLKRKLNELFKDNLQLRQDYLRRKLNWTEEIGKGGKLALLSEKLTDSLNPRGWNSIKRTGNVTN